MCYLLIFVKDNVATGNIENYRLVSETSVSMNNVGLNSRWHAGNGAQSQAQKLSKESSELRKKEPIGGKEL